MSDSALQNRSILLIVGGGIAAYKCLELIRRLRDKGVRVRVILTEAGAQFVTPLSVGTLTGEPVFQSLFDLTREAEIGHIELSRDADLLVVAPATADLMAKMANGLAGDLATTTLLATDKPVLIAPAMNVRMWAHRATQRNLERLMADGIEIVGPNEGPMACNEYGPGRMAESAEILAAIEQHFSENAFKGELPLKGIKALVTSGPTHEPIDPVRYLANRSSGKQGYAIATALARLGAETVLVSGPTNLSPPPGVTVKNVETAREMLAACEASLPVDVAVCAAAVADWRVDIDATQKIKKEPGASTPELRLVENPDILATISHLTTNRPSLVVGFAAETEKVIEHAVAKRARKGCDWIVANDVSPETGVMGGELNTVHLITRDGQEDWPLLPKQAVAERLARRILAHFTDRDKNA
ncbi:bifunctional phosphopantothenoylcysteine decarboxylase/phosphopantothenate--cysteine ligase CoaBC [Parvibaculum sedimenti]|uniref:Coenzyme A biosynthesis bifunctional protein CoaBC n=1 Tax=Parvibaculum sedimenti TaxID=2608632 RepID=A0A6N6VLG7_9HYPH|nr:bifunctional phosphopantothenoylcysteine decarboxylase/phosphopantothenate--cysteine ligase CoaBC [Parvibaculum sedimenti]KAB7742628.1 bifunctional phosphopantothenoylcysteine decarboxylase/phosphopantothenate--cysteine ligase CoaBC [Parvibaculum sedimenti]